MQDLTRDIERTAVLADAGPIQAFGELTMPASPRGVTVLIGGVGSRWNSPRNLALAASLARDGLAAVACDLFSPDEEAVDRITRHLRHDARTLAERAGSVVRWLRRQKRFARLPIGLIGTGTGAPAALITSTTVRDLAAVVACDGRSELTRELLARVRCPVLFVAGAADGDTVVANCRAMRQMSASTSMHLVRGADDLTAPDALADVCAAASGWFARHLAERAYAH